MDYDAFCAAVVERLELDGVATGDPDADLHAETGFDSLQAFELFVLIEELAGADDPDADVPDIRTMREAFAYYESLVRRGTYSTT